MKKAWTIIFMIVSVIIMGIYCFNIMPEKDSNYKVKDLGGDKSVLENDKIVYKFPYNKYKMKKIIISKDGEKTKNVKCESKNEDLNEKDLKDKQFFRGDLTGFSKKNLYEDEKMKLYVCNESKNDSVTSNAKQFLKVYYRDKINNKLKKFYTPLNLGAQNDYISAVYSKPYKDTVKVIIDLGSNDEKGEEILIGGTIDLKKETFNREKVIGVKKEVISKEFIYGNKFYYVFKEKKNEKQVMVNSISLDNYKISKEGTFESEDRGCPDLIIKNKMFFITSLKNNKLDVLCFDLDKKEIKKYNNIYLAENVKDIRQTITRNIQLIDIKGNRAYFDISNDYNHEEDHYRYVNVVDLYKNKSLYFASVAEKIEDYSYATVE